MLVQEAGVEPGPELRRLHTAIFERTVADLPASRSALAPLARARLRGRRAVTLGAAVLVVAALATVIVAGRSDSSPPAVPANAVAIIDPAKPSVAGSIALDEAGPDPGRRPRPHGAESNSQSLVRSDAARRRIAATAGMG